MKIGKMRKLLASLLVLALGFGLINNSVIRADGGEGASDVIPNNGLELNKTAVYNEETGETTITLESFVTGKVETGVAKPLDIVLLLDVSGSMKGWKLDSLKSSVKSFIKKTNDVNKKISDDKLKSRISLIKFAGNKTEQIGNDTYRSSSCDNNTCNFTQIITPLQIVNDQVYNNDTAQINKINYGGGTYADYGMQHVESVLTDSEDGREKIVIMFTDGEPNHGSGFDDKVASNVIKTSKELKEKEAKVYTIGIFKDADPSDDPENRRTSKFDKYMHAVSSNYPNASYSYSGDFLGYWSWSFGSREPNSNFYKAAENADELNKIFDDIFNDISKPSQNLDSSTVLQDVVSDYFTFPDNFSAKDVKLYTADIKSISGSDSNLTYDFKERTELVSNDVKVEVEQETKSIKVSGFDYSEKFVGKNQNGTVRGQKLIVEFKVKPIDGFIGGNQVNTNNYSKSGIYKNGEELVENFKSPTVNVPIKYNFNTTDAAMYLTDDWKDFESLIDENKFWTTSIDDMHDLSESFVNDFVNIEYKFSQNGNNIGSYIVNATESSGTWTFENGFATSDLKSDFEKFDVTVTITPIHGGENKTILPANEKNPTLFIFKPVIQSSDYESVFLGDKYNNLENNVQLVDWKCQASDWKNVYPKDSIKKPTITYKFKYNGKVISEFEPKNVGIHEIEYNVYANSKDITLQTRSVHNASIGNHSECNEKHFYIDVKGGTIKINKFISNNNLYKHDFTNGDPIFGFKIDKLNDNNDVEKTYYRYVRFYKGADGNIVRSSITPLTDLPKGKYRVTEMSSMRFKCDSVLLDNDEPTEDNEISFEISSEKEESDRTVTFTNSLVKDNYFSDTDVVVNSFTTDESGKVVFSQDWLNGKKSTNGQTITKLERR